MKKTHQLIFLCLLACVSQKLFSQQQQNVRFANGDFITGLNIKNQSFKKENIQPALFENKYFVLVQFANLPGKQVQENLQKEGMQLGEYLPGKAYLATIKNNFDFAVAKQYGIVSINIITPAFKINKRLINYQPTNDKSNAPLIAVSYFKSLSKNYVQKQLQKAGAIVVATKYETANIIFIKADVKIINAIAALPFISSLTLQVLNDKPLNYNTRAAHGVSGLNALNGKNLNGKGLTVGIGDNADASSHVDFAGRLIERTSSGSADHGTHTSGTVAGAGIINVKYRGMASKATLINGYFSDIIINTPTYITDNNMVLSNNSYYSGLDFCPGEGEYDVLSNYIDNQTRDYSQFLHVTAAGNDGALSCAGFPASFATVKSGWQSAKNVLTVGAMNVQNYSIASFSSRGPVADGRIKPEVTASGWAVTSTTANNTYSTFFGTSMACPAATGALTLIYERYRQLHGGTNPSGALMKALLCNTAEDLGNAGPDYTFGFGMINARRAVESIENNLYSTNSVSNGGSNNQVIVVPANTRRLKVMLYWPDTAAAPNAAAALVNDLDITVADPAAIIHQPLILNPSPLNVNDVATEGADHTNNIEQVVIENPAAGNYTVNVAGFSVPFGPQQYILSYQVVQPSVTVEYPFGGETLVPGETENIRWNAYGNETNNFTIDYSADNGVTWATINNNVPAASSTYAWTVPAAVTNNALIRVSRNGTLLTGQSNFNFIVLGQPALTATNVCQGAVQLNWANIPGATAYDILQLTGDSMKVIGNTGSNTFLVQGLDKNTTAWIGVAAKNGTFSGRRSISVSTLPSSGACTLSTFNNDLQIDSILSPATARQHFANESNATAPVKIIIRNSGAVAVTGPFNVSYSYGGAPITEIVNTTIAPGAVFTYTFTGLYTIISSGYNYNFKAWVTFAADGNHLNDTAYKIVKSINNDAIIAMPVMEGFETMADTVFTKPEMAIGGNKYLDFSANTFFGRARTFVNTGFARSGIKSLTLDQSPANATTTADSLTLNYNLVNYSAGQMRFDFFYNNHGQANYPGNKIWIRGSENDTWVQAYDLFVNQADLGLWKHGNININDVLNNAVPAQIITQTFQIKIGEEGLTSANSSNPVIDIDDGYTFDDLILNQVNNDIELKKIISPDRTGCGLGANNPVSINIKNYNNAILNNINVSYQVNGGTVVTETIASIAANQSLNYTFVQTTDLSAYIDYSMNVWVNYPGDSYYGNDSILNYNFHNTPVINTYPYLQSFETDNGNFYTNGINSSWQWGAPAKTIINKAANGAKAWVTNLTGNYNDNETSYLYSPCFDVSSMIHPMLSFSHIFDVELNYDYTWIEYSTDGIIWQKLGTAGNGTNWFNDTTLNNWRLSNKKWHVASIDLPLTPSNIRFRFVLSSDGGVNMEGIGIDDISVHEKSMVATNPPVTTISVPSVSGSNWVPFNTGNQATGPWYVLAEINPNGQDLGKVDINLYGNATGTVRNINNQYYLDRNFVIHPANAPAGNVGVRLYFTDAEADSLINATGCLPCTKPGDAYELGVTKYSGTAAEENGILGDDISGLFKYITPANTAIIPHANGYYAEFTVNSFSEFWFNNGGIGNIHPLPLNLLSFDVAKVAGKALLEWKTANEINTAKFIVERSGNARNYTIIGSVAAGTNNNTSNYKFTDSTPLPGLNYYRLKMIDNNGNYTTSLIRKLDFNNINDDLLIYPNPVVNSTIFIISGSNCTGAILYDASLNLVKSFALHGKNNTINIKGLTKGIYLLKVFENNTAHTEKIMIQ